VLKLRLPKEIEEEEEDSNRRRECKTATTTL
jgi:hypothetical protein